MELYRHNLSRVQSDRLLVEAGPLLAKRLVLIKKSEIIQRWYKNILFKTLSMNSS